ncbi:MAG: glycosyl transferase [Flavobacteriales bacterium]|nr:glycosyl transferase [Flavobacteriales bacterium]
MEKSKIKIAFLSVFHPFRGGIAQFNTELFKALEAKSDISAFNFTTQYPELLFPGKTQFVDNKDLAPHFETPRILSSVNPFSFIKTAKAIKDFSPDVLISSYWMPFFGPSLGMVCKRLKKTTLNISIVHNAIPHEKRLGDKMLSGFYFKQQHGFVTMSETVKNDLNTLIKNPATLLRPHPLYAQFGDLKDKNASRLKYGIKKDQKVLLFFGFIRKYKGLDLLLEALSHCREDIVLLIAGECYGEFSEYQKIIHENQIDSRVFSHIRYIPDSEVSDVFSASDVCVLPYRTATQSGIASIAKFYQVPMVVTPVGELPNEIIPNQTGIVCESSKPIHIAQAINDCLDAMKIFSGRLKDEKDIHTWENFANAILSFSGDLKV